MITEAPDGASEPRPQAITSYPDGQARTSDRRATSAEFTNASWPTRSALGDRLVAAASAAPRPLDARDLACLAGIPLGFPREILEDTCLELSAAGRLVRHARREPGSLWSLLATYSAPPPVPAEAREAIKP